MRDGEIWGGPWEQEASPSDMSNVHAVNASTAAYHADVAAKHAASLAQWVQYLSGTLNALQHKVTELEEWKRTALEETRKLREEHKALRWEVLERLSEEEILPPEGNSVRGTSSPQFRLDCPAGDATFSVIKTRTDSTSTSGSGPLSPGPVSPGPSFSDTEPMKEEGVQVTREASGGTERWRAEWRIAHLSTKLRGCMGRALVSSPFDALGLEDLRLMICPDGKEVAQGPRNRRQKELYTKKITEGPLDGCLKLKIPNCPAQCELEYRLTVGSLRRGPFRHDFAESTVSECDDFGDWLKQLDADRSLTVSVEISRVATPAEAALFAETK